MSSSILFRKCLRPRCQSRSLLRSAGLTKLFPFPTPTSHKVGHVTRLLACVTTCAKGPPKEHSRPKSSRGMFQQEFIPAKRPAKGTKSVEQVMKEATRSHQVKQPPRSSRTGALNRVPVIPQGEEVIVSALKRAGRIGPTKGMKNEAAKAKNMVAKQLDALTKELTVPLGKWIRGFPDPEHLHPFEKALLALSLGDDRYERTIGRVDTLRKSLLGIGRSVTGQAAKVQTKKDVLALREKGFEDLEVAYRKEMESVDKLKEMSKILRMLPVVEPTVCAPA
ncbi:hypothetical protein CYMTET_49099 [Cymbomonas tetramitiformis]|uniref:NOG1 N-terminal helical domain-containing protein n=1 Tax=Cymbomonas tetramitiformis TaxID=36881 RepID=A0AAE0BSU6_9CHLO|nr:hypothetical protein CYMTET_49099 [Cymbomonas tetramitiformis]